MIPKHPTGPLSGQPDKKRRVLFALGQWEIVSFSNREKAYAVHICHNYPTPRAITTAPAMSRGARGEAIQCWNCFAVVPEEIITITELYNG
jgi:hypothetical protein